jgi:hypothetical protein
MKLIEINSLYAKSAQGCIAFLPNRLWLEDPSRLRVRVALIPNETALGED